MTKKESQKKALLEALRANMGIESYAYRAVGISRQLYFLYKKEDVDFTNAVRDIQEESCDFAESALFQLIAAGNPQAIIFFAKTRMRNRGYGENLTLDTTNTIIEPRQMIFINKENKKELPSADEEGIS